MIKNKSMNIHKIPFDGKLKKLQFDQITFYTVALKNLTQQGDGSHASGKLNFRDELLECLSDELGEEVLKLLIVSPAKSDAPFEAFAYMKDRHIVALHWANEGLVAKGMHLVLNRWNEGIEKSRKEGRFEQQPELNPNPQALIFFSKGLFSIQSANSGMRFDERPYEDTGKFLHKHAPDKYNEAKIAREKRNYLKKYINTAGSAVDAERLKDLFLQFIAKRALEINPPIDNETIYQEFEELSGFSFPEELKVLLAVHNGVCNTGFLDANHILKEWKGWKAIYDEWQLQELKGNNYPDGRKTLGMYTTPYWVPFLSTGSGNFIGIDYVPGGQGKSGQIIAFGADENKIRWIAEDMSDFLQQFLDEKDVLNRGFDS